MGVIVPEVLGVMCMVYRALMNNARRSNSLRRLLFAGVVLFASALILFETSQVIHGGETNYIRATVGLYVSIYNLFVSLLHLLGAFGED